MLQQETSATATSVTETTTPASDVVVQTVVEEYEQKIKTMQEAHKLEIETLNKNHIAQVRAILTGQRIELVEEPKDVDEDTEQSIIDRITNKFRRN